MRYVPLEALDVLDPDTMQPVPRDGETLGEVMFRGNVVMKGYLKNKTSTDKAFAGGWFHSGDLGVMHPDGYVQLKDRSKDIIISGGENISSIEVEDALYKHPAVQAAAVVAKPDEKWGETPCAFVELKPGQSATTDELMAWCKNNLAGYKVPAPRRVRRAAEDQHGEDSEVQAAGDGEGGVDRPRVSQPQVLRRHHPVEVLAVGARARGRPMAPGPKPKRDGRCCTPNCMLAERRVELGLAGRRRRSRPLRKLLRLLFEVELRNLVALAAAVRGLAAEREGLRGRRRQRKRSDRGQSAQLRDFQGEFA